MVESRLLCQQLRTVMEVWYSSVLTATITHRTVPDRHCRADAAHIAPSRLRPQRVPARHDPLCWVIPGPYECGSTFKAIQGLTYCPDRMQSSEARLCWLLRRQWLWRNPIETCHKKNGRHNCLEYRDWGWLESGNQAKRRGDWGNYSPQY